MRIFYLDVGPFHRYIDMDHIQEMSDIVVFLKPSVAEIDRDGLKIMTNPHGRAHFWIRYAFQTECVEYELDYRQLTHYYGENTREKYNREVIDGINAFELAYRRLREAWMEKDGQPASFAVVRT